MRRLLLPLALLGAIGALCAPLAAAQGVGDQRREVERLEAELAALDAEEHVEADNEVDPEADDDRPEPS